MDDRKIVLKEALDRTGVTQSALARMSGVRQSSISQFLSGRAPFSDEMLERLLECLGFRLMIERHASPVAMSRSDRLRWALHRRLAEHLDDAGTLASWDDVIRQNLDRLRGGVRGEPHLGNLGRWEAMLDGRDVRGIRHAMTGLDDDSIALREVSPLGGLLSQDERAAVRAELAA